MVCTGCAVVMIGGVSTAVNCGGLPTGGGCPAPANLPGAVNVGGGGCKTLMSGGVSIGCSPWGRWRCNPSSMLSSADDVPGGENSD